MGIDSSTTSTGWAIVEEDGIVASGVIKPKGETIERIIEISQELCKIYREYEPVEVYIEDLSVTRNMKTLKSLSGLLYVILTSLYKQDAVITLLKPTQWRKGKVEGRTREQLKQSAIQYIKEKYGLYAEEDTAEAIIIAEWEE
jgi:Holliday junction resolvasome RuvABC endonuclease subunit